MASLSKFLSDVNACHRAIKWAKGKRDWRKAWDDCQHPDWLLWISSTVPLPLLVRAGVEITRRAITHAAAIAGAQSTGSTEAELAKAGVGHARKAMQAAEKWLADSTEKNWKAWALAARRVRYINLIAPLPTTPVNAVYYAAQAAADVCDAAKAPSVQFRWAAVCATAENAAVVANHYETSLLDAERKALADCVRQAIPYAAVLKAMRHTYSGRVECPTSCRPKSPRR